MASDLEIEKDCLLKPAYLDMLKKALNGCEQSQLSMAYALHSGTIYEENQIEAYAWASIPDSHESSNLLARIKNTFTNYSELLIAQDFSIRLKRIVES